MSNDEALYRPHHLYICTIYLLGFVRGMAKNAGTERVNVITFAVGLLQNSQTLVVSKYKFRLKKTSSFHPKPDTFIR